MKTYQDLLEVGENLSDLGRFIMAAISEHKSTPAYKTAVDARLYYKWQNPTIMKYRKLLYTITGKQVPDNYSANHKCAGNFLSRFVTQEAQYLLGNGVQFEEMDEDTKKRILGKDFDTRIQKASIDALIEGVTFGFYNNDHIETFRLTEFVPLYDEENGSLRAGIRFWQIADNKPLRCTLYEMDGFTEFIRPKNETELRIYQDKRAYKQIIRVSEADGFEVVDGSNYEGFPIVPMYANDQRQSVIVGLREQIDCYDLIKSGFANDLDDASMIYWTIHNAGGMDDIDLAKFLDHMKRVKAAVVEDDGASAEAHTIDVPYQSRTAYLERLEKDMYRDAMAVDTDSISAGNVTATAIRAAYQSLEDKCDGFEYCVTEFIHGILALAGIDDEPTYKRNRIANMTEETQMVLSAAGVLDDETILRHLPFLTPDEVDGILDRKAQEQMERMPLVEGDDDGQDEGLLNEE